MTTGEAERVTVLMYHRIGIATNDWERKYTVSPAQFAAQMRRLQANGFQACPIADFVAWLAGQGTSSQGRLRIDIRRRISGRP